MHREQMDGHFDIVIRFVYIIKFFMKVFFQVEPPASKKAKITGLGSGGKGQTGIMSFFKKK